MDEEISALKENNTYEFTPLPENRSVVGGRWVFSIKLGPNGEETYKARYVAKGYSQIKDINYHETFSTNNSYFFNPDIDAYRSK